MMHSKCLSRIVRTIVAGLALTATVTVSAQLVNETRPYSGTTTNPCNGEAVVFSGSIHHHEKTQVGADGRIHFVAHDNFNVSGRGQSTGATYNMSGTMNTNAKFQAYPIKFRQRTRFISTSYAAPSFHMTVVFHVNGAGVPTQNSTESDCKN